MKLLNLLTARIKFEYRMWRRKRIRIAEQKRARFWKAEKARAR